MKTMSISESVAAAVTPSVAHMAGIPAPFNAVAVLQSIASEAHAQLAERMLSDQKARSEARHKVQRDISAILQNQIAEVSQVESGDAPLRHPMVPVPLEASDVRRQTAHRKNLATTFLNAVPRLKAKGWLAFAVAFLLLIAATACITEPVVRQILGANGQFSDLSAWSVAALVSIVASYVLATTTVPFFRPSEQRWQYMGALVVGAVVAILYLRYATTFALADFSFMSELSEGTVFAIRLLKIVGFTTALFLLELSAGRLFAYWWHVTITLPQYVPSLELLLKQINETEASTVLLSQPAHSSPAIAEIVLNAAHIITTAVSVSIAGHRSRLDRILQSQKAAFVGAGYQDEDVDALRAAIDATDDVCHELMRLAAAFLDFPSVNPAAAFRSTEANSQPEATNAH